MKINGQKKVEISEKNYGQLKTTFGELGAKTTDFLSCNNRISSSYNGGRRNLKVILFDSSALFNTLLLKIFQEHTIDKK